MREQFKDWRNTQLSSPSFHRFARRNVLTRWMARRRARQLFDVCAGFVYSQVLDACISLNLFDDLVDGPKTRTVMAEQANIPLERFDVLLRAAISLKLLESRGADRVALGIHGAALMANPGVLNMVKHHRLFYADVQNPVRLFEEKNAQTELAALWDYSANGADQADLTAATQRHREHYTELMSSTQAVVAEQIVDCVPFKGALHLLDVGGNDGTFLRNVGAAYPHIELTLFDLPSIASNAETVFDQLGFGDRTRCVGGDMHTDELPGDADTVSLIRVLHDHDNEEALALLQRCRRALKTSGRLLLAEPMGVELVGDPATDAYFGLYFRAMGRGRCRTASENRSLLKTAGFKRVVEIKTAMPFLARVLVASV